MATTIPSDASAHSADRGCPQQIEPAVLLNRLADAIDLETRCRSRRNTRGPDFVSLQTLFEEICRRPIPIPAAHRSIVADVAAATPRASQNLCPTLHDRNPAPIGIRDRSHLANGSAAWQRAPQGPGKTPRNSDGEEATRAPASDFQRQAKRIEGRIRMEDVLDSAADSRAHVVKLRERREIAENTFAFLFDKPDGFTFKAGQFIELSLNQPHAIDARGKTRRFSLASAPSENLLMVTTRVRDSALKRALKTSPLGTEVEIEGPSGQLTLHEDYASPAVFIAGGIGITPFRSMLLDAIAARLPHRFFLFYSNRRPEDAPFLDELQAIERAHWNLTLIAIMTQADSSRHRWSGETSVLDQEMIERFLRNVNSPTYYVAGPPRMVQGLHTVLGRLGTKSERIRSEVFQGY